MFDSLKRISMMRYGSGDFSFQALHHPTHHSLGCHRDLLNNDESTKSQNENYSALADSVLLGVLGCFPYSKNRFGFLAWFGYRDSQFRQLPA